jgi:hypothetical protein
MKFGNSPNPLLLRIHLDAVEEIRTWNTHAALQDPVASFLSNISLLRDYLVLPAVLLDYLTMMRLWDERANLLFPLRDPRDPLCVSLRDKSLGDAASWVQEHFDDQAMLDERLKQQEIHFNVLLQAERFRESMRAFLLQSIVSAWSIFEMFTRECWERIERDFIRLSEKRKKPLRFNTLKSLRNSYSILLGDHKFILGVFDTEDLKELDATRQLIVHRAGIVDKIFLQAAQCDLPVGSPLQVDAGKTSKLINASIDCGKDFAHRLNICLNTELSQNQTRP